MHLIVAALIGGLAQAMASLVGRALLALGIVFVTYTGYSVGVDWLFVLIKTSYADAGDVALFLSFLWVDKAIGLVFSAFAASMAIKVSLGSITKMAIKK